MRRPAFWLACFLCWIAAMWGLSSSPKPLGDHVPDIPFIDKILHFGWFMGGTIILSAFLMLRRRPHAPQPRHAIAAIGLVALIGATDEWHQSFVPGRSGNDPGDWAADVAGAAVGVLIFRRLCGILLLDETDSACQSQPESR